MFDFLSLPMTMVGTKFSILLLIGEDEKGSIVL